MYSFKDVFDLGYAFLLVFGGFGGYTGSLGELRVGMEKRFGLFGFRQSS